MVIAFLSWGILQALGRESARLIELIGIMLVSGVLTSFTLIFGLLALVFASYKYGLDPDNLIGPIVTTLGDVFGVVFLFVAHRRRGGILMAAADSDDPLNAWTIRHIVRTMFPILLVLSMLEMGSGYILEALEETYPETRRCWCSSPS